MIATHLTRLALAGFFLERRF